MRQVKNNIPLFAICIDNSGYLASLELHKIYRVLPDERAAADDLLRVIDESGEDYLFSAERFILMEVPIAVKRALLQSSNGRKTAKKPSRQKQTVRDEARSKRVTI
jgi:Ca2+-binding EF-hand superfamily protein